MNLRQAKFIIVMLTMVAVFHLVGMHVALNERDEARAATKNDAISKLCEGYFQALKVTP